MLLASLLFLNVLFLFCQGNQIVYPSYETIIDRMHALAQRAPHLVELWNAQERYGTPSPRGKCPGNVNCLHWFIRLSNRSNIDLSELDSFSERPSVFLSGNLHGNEEVGPVTVITLAELLVEAALAVERKERTSPYYNMWLANLINTRNLVMIPVTNPLGYTREVREEDGIDPNRDFPFGSLADNDVPFTGCMATATARAVNEVWREHLFQLAITYHGGMEAIAYEWGAWNHMDHNSVSPDDAAQASLANVMRDAAGAFKTHHYPVGRMNPLVYPVHGGMEDWAYAGSWDDRSVVNPCIQNNSPLGDYPVEKTMYNDAQLRAVNVLVETWNMKKPFQEELGSNSVESLLTVEGNGDGHVPRNVRLALSMLDLVEPYVQITARRASNDITNLQQRFWLGWDVGGAVHVDSTSLFVSQWDVRVPINLFSQAKPARLSISMLSAMSSTELHDELSNLNFNDSFLIVLENTYGFTESEARQFSKRLLILQLFVAGSLERTDPLITEISLLDQPSSSSQSGGTRWAWTESKRPLIGRPKRIDGKQDSSSRVQGAPDIQHFPFETRFEACFSISSANAQAQFSPNSPKLSVSDCLSENNIRPDFTSSFASGGSGLVPDSSFQNEYTPFNSNLINNRRELAFIAIPFAVVDASFAVQASTPDPINTKPQTHWANIRTNPEWRKSNAGYKVHGRYHFASKSPAFFKVNITDVLSDSSIKEEDGSTSSSSSSSSSIFPTGDASSSPTPTVNSGGVLLKDTEGNVQPNSSTIALVLFSSFITVFCLGLAVYTWCSGGISECLGYSGQGRSRLARWKPVKKVPRSEIKSERGGHSTTEGRTEDHVIAVDEEEVTGLIGRK
jgi:hypothetical protein